MAYDTAALRERVDLVELVGRDTSLRQVSGSGEQAGPCPRCGGRDRFHVKPGYWFCRQCYPIGNDKPHDAIAYIMWRDDCDFSTACDRLGGQRESPATPVQRRAPPKTTPVAEPVAPPTAWQERGRAFVAYAVAKLWDNPAALAYLRDRGLTDETIVAAQLGYNPANRRFGDSRWGVWLPRGWVIPGEVDGVLWYVKVRRLDEDLAAERQRGRDPDKYHTVAGSKCGGVLYGLEDLRGHADGILCEGEFDALLLRQHVGALAGVAALPSASGRPGPLAWRVLVGLSRIWVAFDADTAGQSAAQRWGSLSARVRRLPPPAKDITDAWRAGCDLAAWVAQAIRPPVASAMAAREAVAGQAPALSAPQMPETRAEWLAHMVGGAWRPTEAPDDLAPAYAWTAITHRWYANAAGQYASVA